MNKHARCPNCGKRVDALRDGSEFVCAHCGETLVVSLEDKVVLAHPVQTFADPDFAASPSDGVRADNQISAVRRKRAADLALERTLQEKEHALRGFVYGILSVVFGGLLIVLAFLRYLFLADDWLNLIGLGLGLIFIPLGVYVAIWFSVMARNKGKEQAEIMREREILAGE